MAKERLYKNLPRPKLTRAEIAEIYERLCRENPNPRTELNYSNPYTLVVAVALSAQATDVGVNRATRALFEKADTPQAMVDLGEDIVRDHIKTIGLYRNKASNVIKLSRMILDDFGGDVPTSREDLIKLPGVGRKTANVVMNEAFGQPTMAVDTHIFRVSNRTGMAPGKDPVEVELNLLRVTPDQYMMGAHHWILLHGRYTCVARTPKCYDCRIADLCRYKPKTAPP
ncbi:endonuclease III [Algimonas ampicilliniresistens]|uniref:Endonuclease III n=1 Tax=Algimonas ampicilliniresistens TaxID=1298735 RepID=A0ABQ5V977_9PROT|nr:endonuclease III [Algimonas ampicilliniresistens]GLQ24079.1 endonuclease III [Algimonas ampicilliniresistens]